MSGKRIRMLAGPNGSGKSTLLETLAERFSLGRVLNPDLLEREIKASGRLDFSELGIMTSEADLRAFFDAHPMGRNGEAGKKIGSVVGNVLSIDGTVEGYFAAILSDFLRRKWIEIGESFTFETVMSSDDKVKLLADARAIGYRTYLYYVCLSNPLINRERVSMRVGQGGHGVPEGKIAERYLRSLGFLWSAIENSDRAYIFDNSGTGHRLIAEFENHTLRQVSEDLPAWFVEYVLNKM